MPKLTRVAIRRFKRLAQVDIDLDDITLLIGANNSGKSSVLQALHFAISVAQTSKLVGEGLAWRNDQFQLSFNPAQLIYSPVADVMSMASGGNLQEGAQSRVEVTLTASDGSRCTVALRRGRNRNIAVTIEGRQLGDQFMDLEHPFTVYAPGLAGVAREERYMSPGVVRRIVARGDANLVLRNVLRMLRANEPTWVAFIEDMRSLFPGINVNVEFNETSDEYILVQVRLPGGPRLPIDAAGTSILQASQIFGYISLFQPQVLILDEPDSHLHPDNQRVLCALVRKLALERQFQALISTHSRHVLDALKGLGKIVWLNKGDVVDASSLNTTAVLLDIGALDSVDYFADGEIRCIVATEDADTDAIRALLWSNGFSEPDTDVRSYTGCTKLDAALVLGAFLRERAPNVRLIVHRDSDYIDQARAIQFQDTLHQAGVTPFMTQYSDIEGYYLNAAHLHALNPAVPLERIAAIIEQATADTRNDSIEAIINQRTQRAFEDQRRGGAPPNHGAIGITAHADYDGDPIAFRRGKIVLKRVIAMLRQELHAAPIVFAASEHLEQPAVAAMAQFLAAEEQEAQIAQAPVLPHA